MRSGPRSRSSAGPTPRCRARRAVSPIGDQVRQPSIAPLTSSSLQALSIAGMPMTNAQPSTAVALDHRGLGAASGGRCRTRLVADGWHVVIDARDADGLRAPSPGCRRPASRAIPGDVSDGWHRARAGRGRRRARPPRPAGQQRVGARAEPPAGPRRPTRRRAARACSRSTRSRRSRSRRCVAARCSSARGGRVVNVSSDAAVEAYEGWGGYGAVQGGARPAHRRPRGRAPRAARLRVRPRRHGDRPCTSRPSRARTSATGRRPRASCPALMRLVEGDLPSGRYRRAPTSVRGACAA